MAKDLQGVGMITSLGKILGSKGDIEPNEGLCSLNRLIYSLNRNWESASARHTRKAKNKDREKDNPFPQESKMMAAWYPCTKSLETRKQTLEREGKASPRRPYSTGFLKAEREFATQKRMKGNSRKEK